MLRLAPTSFQVLNGEIFICADGIRSAFNGYAAGEGLCERAVGIPGITHLIANADVSGGVVELFLSSDPRFGTECLMAHSKSVCFYTTPSPTRFRELKESGTNAISRRLKNAYALEVSGFTMAGRREWGEYFENIVRDNIMFVGDASGGAGNIHGMIQGQFAGTVAASAIKNNDISEKGLSEYQDLVVNTVGKAQFFFASARKDFGSYDNWFRKFEESTKGIKATELVNFCDE